MTADVVSRNGVSGTSSIASANGNSSTISPSTSVTSRIASRRTVSAPSFSAVPGSLRAPLPTHDQGCAAPRLRDRDQFVADAGVEEIIAASSNSTWVAGYRQEKHGAISQFFIWNPADETATEAGVRMANDSEPVDPRLVGAGSHKTVSSFCSCSMKRSGFQAKDLTGELFDPHSLPGWAEFVRSRKGEPKWPGKPRRSSKCRSAWKSTCMCAPPASKRQRHFTILTQVDLRAVTNVSETVASCVCSRASTSCVSQSGNLQETDHASRRRPGRRGRWRRSAVELRMSGVPDSANANIPNFRAPRPRSRSAPTASTGF